MACPVRLLKRA